MNVLTTTVARILFAVPFAIFGIIHFVSGSAMAGLVPSWLPGATFWVYLTGLAHIAAAVAILIRKQARLACLLLALMLIIFVLTIHLPAVLGGDQMAMSQLLKDTSLAGGALILAGISTD